jgi:hypothetical protein
MTGAFFHVTSDEETARLPSRASGRRALQRLTQDAGLKARGYKSDPKAHLHRRHVGHPVKKSQALRMTAFLWRLWDKA